MSEQNCGSCRFWADPHCRRMPPVPQRYEYENSRKGYMESDVVTLWPKTYSTDWCGEFAQTGRTKRSAKSPTR